MNLVKKKKRVIVLIDEILHSISIFLYRRYQERQDKEKSKQLSKSSLVNQNGFQGLEGQQIPDMTEEYIETVSERYIELYEKILGEKLKADISNINERIEKMC
jgi:phosphoribosylaminoimidazole-succinocarboxamide synthase